MLWMIKSDGAPVIPSVLSSPPFLLLLFSHFLRPYGPVVAKASVATRGSVLLTCSCRVNTHHPSNSTHPQAAALSKSWAKMEEEAVCANSSIAGPRICTQAWRRCTFDLHRSIHIISCHGAACRLLRCSVVVLLQDDFSELAEEQR